MFGLFKKRTGIVNLLNDLSISFEKIISLVRKEYGNEVTFPIMANIAMDNAEKDFQNKKAKLAKEYSVSEDQVNEAITEISKTVYKKYFTYKN